VQKLRLADGAFVAAAGGRGPQPGGAGDHENQFNSPTGLAVGGNELVPLLYVCDENNHRIVVLGDRVDSLVWHYDFGGCAATLH